MPGPTGSHWVTLGHAGSHWVAPGHTRSHQVTRGHAGSHQVTPCHPGKRKLYVCADTEVMARQLEAHRSRGLRLAWSPRGLVVRALPESPSA